MIEIFTIKFLTEDTILKPSPQVASGNKTEILVFRNHISCPRILKLIRRKMIEPPWLQEKRVLFMTMRSSETQHFPSLINLGHHGAK